MKKIITRTMLKTATVVIALCIMFDYAYEIGMKGYETTVSHLSEYEF